MGERYKINAHEHALAHVGETRRDIEALAKSIDTYHTLNPHRVLHILAMQQTAIEYLLERESMGTKAQTPANDNG